MHLPICMLVYFMKGEGWARSGAMLGVPGVVSGADTCDLTAGFYCYAWLSGGGLASWLWVLCVTLCVCARACLFWGEEQALGRHGIFAI